MNQQQILALINDKIAGQGNQIDSGGALAEILAAIAGAAAPIEVADITALTDDQLDALNVGDKVAKAVLRHEFLPIKLKGKPGIEVCVHLETTHDVLFTELELLEDCRIGQEANESAGSLVRVLELAALL